MDLQARPVFRAINGVGSALRRLGLPLGDFNPDALEAAAKRETRLNDFGSARYRAPLERLCQSYAEDAELTFVGRMICHGWLLHVLKNRLQIQRDLAADPAIRQEEIRKPLFVLGLPRTGTTLLFNLLAQDPACRPLMFWESMCPSPSPRPETYATDPRIAQARRQMKRLNQLLPEVRDIHEFQLDGPEECLGLLMNCFLTPFFRGKIPHYRAWLDEIPDSEIVAAYAEYKSQLQLLQRHVRGSHWLLKCPSHLYSIVGLLENFPDACVVQTHRELSRTAPSLCSLNFVFEQLCYRGRDPHTSGRQVLGMMEQLLRRGLRGRDAGDPDGRRVLDVSYSDVVRDPVAAVERIYTHFGYPLTPEFQQRMRTFQTQQMATHQSKHAYSLEQFGITTDELQARFGEYLERFHVGVG